MKFKVFTYKSVTSTNDVAIKLIKKRKTKFGYVLANKQTRGRGTYGKKWISRKGNLFGSIFFQLKSNYPPFSEFSIINPVLISNVLSNFCEKRSIKLKWPNDVFVNKKKICGILQEHLTLNKRNFLIVGIGLNILSNPQINNKYKTTNIFKETNKKPEVNKIIKKIISSYENFFINLSSYSFKNYKKKAESMVLN